MVQVGMGPTMGRSARPEKPSGSIETCPALAAADWSIIWSRTMRVAVIGAGGVGGYFGGRLAQAAHEVHFVARGEHLRAIRDRGLRVRSVRGDFEVRAEASDDPAEIGPCDYVLFCVKSFDTKEAASKLAPLLHAETAVISLQNGIDNEEVIAAEIGWEHVMGGVAFIFASIAEEPGVIEDRGGPARIVFGEWDGQESMRGTRLLEMFREAGADAVDRHVRFAEQLEPDGRSSLDHDKAHGRRMELEALHGTVVRLARKHAFPSPASEAIYALLQPWALRNEKAASRTLREDRRQCPKWKR